MRFIIYGAGGIGCVVGARLFQHGHEVVLVARGAHLHAMRDHGLSFHSPSESTVLSIPCAGHPSEIAFGEGDVVFLTMKGQDTRAALEDLRSAAGDGIPVVCCQNGVANERMALRRFSRVYAMLVKVPATFLVPGKVQTEAEDVTGILDAGCYPAGTDPCIEKVTRALSASRFSARPDPRVMRLKYAKLLQNLKNSLVALCGPVPDSEERTVLEMVRREAVECFRAAGIEWASRDEYDARSGDLVRIVPVDGRDRPGGSSWQSVARRTGNIETDYLNGEIVLLGRLHGIATTANLVLQRLANRLIREGGEPGSWSVESIRSMIVQAGGRS